MNITKHLLMFAPIFLYSKLSAGITCTGSHFSGKLNSFSGSTTFTNVTVKGKAIFDGTLMAQNNTTFDQGVDVNSSSIPLSYDQADLVINNSSISGTLTATVSTIFLEQANLKDIVVKKLNGTSGDELPQFIELKGSSIISSITFESGKGMVVLSKGAKVPCSLNGATIVSAEEAEAIFNAAIEKEIIAKKAQNPVVQETKKPIIQSTKNPVIEEDSSSREIIIGVTTATAIAALVVGFCIVERLKCAY